METVKRPHAVNFVKWAEKRPEVVVLSADLTSSCEANDFRDAYPDRFFSMGMAEQNMMGFAAGLAREGFRPFIHTFAVFITRRAFDQVAMSIAYPDLPVVLLGFLPGITTPGGVTHQAIDDVALMRTIPNMTVLVCGDATDVETVIDTAFGVGGPVYVSMLRGEVPRLFDPDDAFKLSAARVLKTGTDIAVFSSGICTEEAVRATRVLENRGLSLSHLHVSTLKPFNDEAVLDAAANTSHGVISFENHSITGGLGSALAEAAADSGIGIRLKRLGIRDTYAHGASRSYLMKEYGLDAMALVRAVEELTGHSYGITEEELKEVRIEDVNSQAKPEAL